MPYAVDTLKTKRTLEHEGVQYEDFSLPEAARHIGDVSHLPFSLKVVLENLLRHDDGGQTVAVRDIEALLAWLERGCSSHEIAFRPARVLMQDFTGVLAVADLAAMRDAVKAMGGEPDKINPLSPVDLVIDHSVTLDARDQGCLRKKYGARVPAQSGTLRIPALRRAGVRQLSRRPARHGYLPPGEDAARPLDVDDAGSGTLGRISCHPRIAGLHAGRSNNPGFSGRVVSGAPLRWNQSSVPGLIGDFLLRPARCLRRVSLRSLASLRR